jgi:hypothetical protein
VGLHWDIVHVFAIIIGIRPSREMMVTQWQRRQWLNGPILSNIYFIHVS